MPPKGLQNVLLAGNGRRCVSYVELIEFHTMQKQGSIRYIEENKRAGRFAIVMNYDPC